MQPGPQFTRTLNASPILDYLPQPRIATQVGPSPEPQQPEKDQKQDAFKFINPQKFIIQNNFMPVPLMQQKNSIGLTNPNQAVFSGENLTQERFTRSRQAKRRPRAVLPFPQANFIPGSSTVEARQWNFEIGRGTSQGPPADADTVANKFPPQTSGTGRGASFGFASRLSSQNSMDSFRHISGSDAASDEQGNSSMCSFEGHFINVTED